MNKLNIEQNIETNRIHIATWKSLIFMLLFVATSPTITNASLEDLIASFDFDFILNDTILVLDQDDYMDDLDSNTYNDTLFFNISVNTSLDDTYTLVIDVEDINGIVTAKKSEPVSATAINISVNISTALLTNDTFDYAITVYNSSNTLMLRKFRQHTDNYPPYDTTYSLTGTSDVNINNNFIQLNATIDATKVETHNVTVFLNFNESSIKASSDFFNFTIGQNIVPLEFHDEIIKSTHYYGAYVIDTLTIGNKVILVNTSTAVYNFEDFAKTSYFKSYADSITDIDEDNLTDILNINLTVDVKQTDTYTLESKIFDLFDNFVAENSTTLSLSTGVNTVELFFDGPTIYQSKIDGPYILKSATLTNSSGIIVDEVVEPYLLTTSNFSYSEFERPPLPDLSLDLVSFFDPVTSITTANLTLVNEGSADALNVKIDLFDTGSFSWNETLVQLNVSESQSFEFSIAGSTNMTVAVVDFENIVDEEDETNNIVIGGPNLVSSFSRIFSNGLTQVFEFTIKNNLLTADSFSWNVTTGDDYIINSTTLINLNQIELAFVEVEYTYAASGNYSLTAIAGNGTIFDSETIIIEVLT